MTNEKRGNTNQELNSIYRFLDEEKYINEFCKGKILISTLKVCRNYENKQRGDSSEGTLEYNSGTVSGDGDDSDIQKIASRSGIKIGPNCKNISLSNNTRVNRIKDAFLLCTTEKFSKEKLADDFGEFCVKISKPKLFFELLTKALSEKVDLKRAAMGRVIYKKRFYQGTESHPGPIGFLKPDTDIYKEQQEVRLLWNVAKSELPLDPFVINCPEVSKLCARIA